MKTSYSGYEIDATEHGVDIFCNGKWLETLQDDVNKGEKYWTQRARQWIAGLQDVSLPYIASKLADAIIDAHGLDHVVDELSSGSVPDGWSDIILDTLEEVFDLEQLITFEILSRRKENTDG